MTHCPALGVTVSKRSLLRDTTNIDTSTAVVVDTTCETQRLSVTNDAKGTVLNASNTNLAAIVSYPPVITLDISKNRIDAFNFTNDSFLQSLSLADNDIATINGFSFPPQLRSLDLSDNRIQSVARLDLADSLQSLNFSGCLISSMRGLRLPWNLEQLHLTGNPLRELEIREADVPILQRLKTNVPIIPDQQCANTNATLTLVRNAASVCVIPDRVFDTLYAPPSPSSSPPTPPKTSSSNHHQLLIIVLVIGIFVLLVLLYIGYRVYRRKNNDTTSVRQGRRHNSSPDDAKSSGGGLVSSETGERPLGFPMQYYEADDVRFDSALAEYRIPKKDIRKKKVLGRGGFGVVYLAKYRSMTVAVKQLQRDRMKYRTLKHFMKEIRLLASLNHPHIVGFLGLAWSTLHDIAIVLEYLRKGDLYSFLKQKRKKNTKRSKTNCDFEWFLSQSRNTSSMATKSSIAMDIADALVYLHGLQTPIIHRDLKSKNVLLASDLRAKLTDFGISRTQSIEETMTREVGTIAWIAPEVLKGGRYSEKADIYSFGVLLTELDTCHAPYKIGFEPQAKKLTNTYIASMVSAGELQPALLESCPWTIRELTLQCLSYEADNRPSAIEIFQSLQSMVIAGQR